MMRLLPSLFAGLLFGTGLLVSGMTQPAKVIGFLDVSGAWDPSLGGVIGGAVAVHFLAYLLVSRMGRPILAERFALPTRRDIDPNLVVGGAMFGAGWGMAGYCPGPAVTAAASGAVPALLFTGAMLVGMALHRAYLKLRP